MPSREKEKKAERDTGIPVKKPGPKKKTKTPGAPAFGLSVDGLPLTASDAMSLDADVLESEEEGADAMEEEKPDPLARITTALGGGLSATEEEIAALRKWSVDELAVEFRADRTVRVTNRPLAQFTGGFEGNHTIAWVALENAFRANLSTEPAQAAKNLLAVAEHTADSPLRALGQRVTNYRSKKGKKDITLPAVTPGLLVNGLTHLATGAGAGAGALADAAKDYLAWRNTLPFASIYTGKPATGLGEATYAKILAGVEEDLRNGDIGAGDVATETDAEYSVWRLLDVAAIVDELRDYPDPLPADVDAEEKTRQVIAALIATLLDEVYRWAPLTIDALGLLDPAKAVESLGKHLTQRKVEAEEQEANTAALATKQVDPNLKSAALKKAKDSDVWQGRHAWLSQKERQEGIQNRLDTLKGWTGQYPFPPNQFTRTTPELGVEASLQKNKLVLDIQGRPKSPLGDQGSHVTAWTVERGATLNRLYGASRKEASKELAAMIKECEDPEILELDTYLADSPDEGSAGHLEKLKAQRAAATRQMNDNKKKLASTEDTEWLSGVQEVIIGYQNYQNALPFATTFAGSRTGHGEGSEKNKTRKGLFDGESLKQEIALVLGKDVAETDKAYQTIWKARLKEHDRKYKLYKKGRKSES